MYLSFSSLSTSPEVFLYSHSHAIMTNLRNARVNVAHESNSDESSSSIGVENLDLVDIFYEVDPPIHAQNVPNSSSGSGLDFLDDNDDHVVRGTTACVVSLTCAYFNLGIVLSRETECKYLIGVHLCYSYLNANHSVFTFQLV